LEHLLATLKTTLVVYLFFTQLQIPKRFISIFDYGKQPYGDKEDPTKTTKLKRYGQ
jgi:hypothetical protein